MTIPKYEIQIDGKKIDVEKRLTNLSITEKRADSADYVTLKISDYDGKISLPRRGVKMKIALGFLNAAYYEKGIFIVDQISYETAPDIIIISGRSVNFHDSFKIKKDRSWHKKKLFDIVQTIAGDHDLKPRTSEKLKKHSYAHLDQKNESDGAFLKRLCKDLNATLMVKSGYLIIAEKSGGKNISGKLMPTINIKKNQCSKLSFKISDRESGYTGVRCIFYDHWQPPGGVVIKGDKKSLKKIPKQFTTEELAQAAAEAEYKNIRRLRNGVIRLTLCLGNPKITPEMNIKLEGFKEEISAGKWIVDEVKHTCSAKGMITDLILEAKK